MQPTSENAIMHVNPDSVDYQQYFDHLVAYNYVLHTKISEEIESILGSPSNLYGIATTGSDSRYEKGPVSLVEIILFGHQNPENQEVARKLIEHIKKPHEMHFFEDHIEIKPPASQMSECVITKIDGSKHHMTSPNRIIDARHLYGSPHHVEDAKVKLAEEIRSEEGKSIYEHNKNKIREHRRVTLTGTQIFRGEQADHFNLDEGISFYNPDKYLWSFKQGPLRLVQYALIRDQVKALRSGTAISRIMELPKNTIHKLSQIQVMDLTQRNQGQMMEVSDSYKYFLWLYHKAQDAYQTNGLTVMAFDAKEARERCIGLEAICKEPLIAF